MRRILMVCVSAMLLLSSQTWAGTSYTRVTVDPAREHLSFHWKDAKGRRIASIARLATEVKRDGRTLVFATNAGIFSKDFAPLGLFVADGVVLQRLNSGTGGGNFFLQPNGVFYVDGHGGHVVRTKDFVMAADVSLATQSGPMLVEHGKINDKFAVDSKNRLVRSGVGINRDGNVVFVISNGPVSFHEFASYFRDVLNCSDALYLDGVISRMYAPAQGRRDMDGDFVGMVAITK